MGVVHRDIKMQNLFLDKELNIVLGDFGLSKEIPSKDTKLTQVVGTPGY